MESGGRRGVWDKAAIGVVFFFLGSVGVGAAFETTLEKNGAKENDEKTATLERENGRLLEKAKILATPKTETRLNVGELRPGDILAARWADEERNGTPGFWNHLAIVGTDGKRVVEAQKSADGVVTAPINRFLARYSDVDVFRFFDSETSRRAAAFAESRVALETFLTPPLRPEGEKEKREIGESERKKGERSGPRYSWSASLAPFLRSDAATENCVSLVRRAYWEAAGVDYRWKTPDDLARWDKSGDFAKIGRFCRLTNRRKENEMETR